MHHQDHKKKMGLFLLNIMTLFLLLISSSSSNGVSADGKVAEDSHNSEVIEIKEIVEESSSFIKNEFEDKKKIANNQDAEDENINTFVDDTGNENIDLEISNSDLHKQDINKAVQSLENNEAHEEDEEKQELKKENETNHLNNSLAAEKVPLETGTFKNTKEIFPEYPETPIDITPYYGWENESGEVVVGTGSTIYHDDYLVDLTREAPPGQRPSVENPWSGQIWGNDTLNLNYPFELEFYTYLGNAFEQKVADGIALAFHNTENFRVGYPGAGIGIYHPDLGQAHVLEFDTYYNDKNKIWSPGVPDYNPKLGDNDNDIGPDKKVRSGRHKGVNHVGHIAIRSSDAKSRLSEHIVLKEFSSRRPLANGEWLKVIYKWNPFINKIEGSIGNVEFSKNYNIRDDLKDPENVIWGITGSTGPHDTTQGIFFTKVDVPINIIDIPIQKLWADNSEENQNEIEITLKANGQVVESTKLSKSTNSWSHVFKEKPRIDAEGIIDYTIEETPVLGYESYIKGDERTGFIVTNVPDIKVTGVETVYDGKKHTVEVDNIIEGDVIEYKTCEGWSKEKPSFVNVGEYTVDVRVTNPSYNERLGSATVKINPKPITIKVNDAQKYFGKKDPEFTGVVGTGTFGTGPGELVHESDLGNVSYTRDSMQENEAPGFYKEVLDAIYTKNSNYLVTVKKADFTIKELGQLTVIKVDKDGNPISKEPDQSAQFKLMDSTGSIVGKVQTTDKNGKAYFENLDPGEYKLIETKAPDGYRISTKEYALKLHDDNLNVELEIKNERTGWDLPETGGPGGILFMVTGIVLMLLSLFKFKKELYD